MQIRRLLISSTLLLHLGAAGCANVPPEQLPANYDFGPYPTESTTQIETYHSATLIDPESARYNYRDGFVQVVCHTFELRGTPRQIKYAGWGKVFDVNAKNRLGGYVGAEEHIALFTDGTLTQVLDRGEFAIEGCATL